MAKRKVSRSTSGPTDSQAVDRKQARQADTPPRATPARKSMRDVFLGYHKHSEADLDGIWRECVFAVDTNVLLNIYRYENATREDLFRVLRHLRDRVWIPYQVAREFYTNRLDVIRDQASKYEQLSNALTAAIHSLNDGSFRKSGFLRVRDVDRTVRPAVDNALTFIDQQRTAHPDFEGGSLPGITR